MFQFERGFIMLCNNRTEQECIGRNLFGDRKNRLEYLKDINTGDIGFLLNTSKNQLIGPFKAMSKAELDIEKDAWGGEFQAQIQVEPVGGLGRITEAAIVLANAGVDLVTLTSGKLVPSNPVQSRTIADALLASFDKNG